MMAREESTANISPGFDHTSDLINELDVVNIDDLVSQRDVLISQPFALTTDVVGRVLSRMASDANFDEEFRTEISKLISKTELISKVFNFLSGCIFRTQRPPHETRRKVWTKYHKAMADHIQIITNCTGSKVTATSIALEIMQELVDINFPQVAAEGWQIEISSMEEDIIDYIAGYLLRRLKSQHLDAVTKLEDTEGGRLITSLDRGGLTKAKVEFVFVVRQLEATFRSIPAHQLKLELFHQRIAVDVFDQLSGLLDSDAGTSVDDFYADFLNLFYRIRIHQVCKKLFDDAGKKDSTHRRKRPLRDYLSSRKDD